MGNVIVTIEDVAVEDIAKALSAMSGNAVQVASFTPGEDNPCMVSREYADPQINSRMDLWTSTYSFYPSRVPSCTLNDRPDHAQALKHYLMEAVHEIQPSLFDSAIQKVLDALVAMDLHKAVKPVNQGRVAYQPLGDLNRLYEDRQKVTSRENKVVDEVLAYLSDKNALHLCPRGDSCKAQVRQLAQCAVRKLLNN